MVPDELADSLANQFVRCGHKVLDPFCGSGRLILAAGQRASKCVGTDVNPLAILISRAKVSNPDKGVLKRLLDSALKINAFSKTTLDLEPGRKVSWFSETNKKQLTSIIELINQSTLGTSELTFVAAILSATVRDVSYCRNDRWKLHRMLESERRSQKPTALKVFIRRLSRSITSLNSVPRLTADYEIHQGDIRNLDTPSTSGKSSFDVILTSPPYGDSRTTVHYGAISSLCIGALSHLKDLSLPYTSTGEIDSTCLGGKASNMYSAKPTSYMLKQYWKGGKNNPHRRRVELFVSDIISAFSVIGNMLDKDGRAVVIVSNRSVSGWRLRLDKLITDTMRKSGLILNENNIRPLRGKKNPTHVNRLGRASEPANLGRQIVPTMGSETILVFTNSG